MKSLSKTLRSAAFAALFFPVLASAQLPNQGTVLKSSLNLASFSAPGGNDCWGYVSPSGREYAIVGLQNKVAIVEVTNPTSPVVINTIAHTTSTWGDIKVFGSTAYAVTEAQTGIQVIDLSQVDNGVAPLVTTLAPTSRNHNINIDTDSGFLYTCGTRGATGTTTCYSLANPLAPVQVGIATMTPNYQHDVQVVTYNSGPYAGRQILFGCSESRGVEIHDVTDKNAPFLVKLVTYPATAYCHQGWLSADRKYFYADDELDENNGSQATTRSLIFSVEDLANASFVGTFGSGITAIDHNQYWDDGFLFQANYTSGLRIFDAANPLAPVQVGWYDSFPNNNNVAFNGAWSNYPYFPSGNVVVSDINGGMFLIDATEATTRSYSPAAVTISNGKAGADAVAKLASSDNDRLSLASSQVGAVNLEFSQLAFDNSPDKIRLVSEASGSRYAKETVQLYNWTSGNYETIGTRSLPKTDVAIEYTATGSVSRFVNQSTREVKVRIRYGSTLGESDSPANKYAIDQIRLRITR